MKVCTSRGRVAGRILVCGIGWMAVTHGAEAGTVTAPHANDFSTDVAGFVAVPAVRWTHLPASGTYSNEFRKTATTASIEVANLGGAAASAKSFTYTSEFIPRAGGGTFSHVGVLLLSGTDALPDANGYAFRQLISTPNTPPGAHALFMYRNGTKVASTNVATQLRFALGTTFRITVEGVYVDSDGNGDRDALDLTASIRNLGNQTVASLSYRDLAPLTGRHFGFRAYDANDWTSAVEWTSFTVQDDSPPSTVILLR